MTGGNYTATDEVFAACYTIGDFLSPHVDSPNGTLGFVLHMTKDWLPEINDYKWHISCVGHCKIKNNIAYIKTIKEESVLIRHILKTITYRFLGTLTTVGVAYSLGASIGVSTLLGVSELVLKPFIYFAHERLWYNFIKVKK